MYHLIYVSQATRPMSEKDLAAVLEKSRDYNTEDGITGLLIYKFTPSENRANFMQLLEGPEDKVLAAFARIEADKRHHTKVVLEQGEISDRNFPDWSMGFRNADAADLENFDGYSDLGSPEFWTRAKDGELSDALDIMMSFYSDEFADD
ncbi:MAG: BLUF domain-containing protein [Anderseniella sp.]